jgi:hypothetical protein
MLLLESVALCCEREHLYMVLLLGTVLLLQGAVLQYNRRGRVLILALLRLLTHMWKIHQQGLIISFTRQSACVVCVQLLS